MKAGGKWHDPQFIELILGRLDQGEGPVALAREFAISRVSIHRWKCRYRNNPVGLSSAERVTLLVMDERTKAIQEENERMRTRLSLLGVAL